MSYPWKGQKPDVHPTAYVVPESVLLGAVTLGEHSSVWYYAVLRADFNPIIIGSHTNIQDHACIHSAPEHTVVIGDSVTIGHGAVLHACTVGNRVLIGMNSVILDGTVIEDDCVIGAGAVVAPGTRVPKGSLVVGVPGKVIRQLGPSEIAGILDLAKCYEQLVSESKGSE